jgi:hypothetical protein
MHISFRPVKLRSGLLRFVTAGCTVAKKGSRDLRVSTATVFSSYFKAKYFVLLNLICLCSSSLIITRVLDLDCLFEKLTQQAVSVSILMQNVKFFHSILELVIISEL